MSQVRTAYWIAARCPACGGSNCLFVAEGGFITCSRIGCPDPEAAHKVLEREPAVQTGVAP